jgi:hypothetical protein
LQQIFASTRRYIFIGVNPLLSPMIFATAIVAKAKPCSGHVWISDEEAKGLKTTKALLDRPVFSPCGRRCFLAGTIS